MAEKNPFGHPADCSCSPACRAYQAILLDHEEISRETELGINALRQMKGIKARMGKCLDCEEAIPADSSFCPHCGAAQKKTCGNCGFQEVPADGNFCPICGQNQ